MRRAIIFVLALMASSVTYASAQYCANISNKWVQQTVGSPNYTTFDIRQAAGGTAITGTVTITVTQNPDSCDNIPFTLDSTSKALGSGQFKIHGGPNGTCPGFGPVTIYMPLGETGCSTGYLDPTFTGTPLVGQCLVPGNTNQTDGEVTTFQQWSSSTYHALFKATLNKPYLNGTQLPSYDWTGRTVTETVSNMVGYPSTCSGDPLSDGTDVWYMGDGSGADGTDYYIDGFGWGVPSWMKSYYGYIRSATGVQNLPCGEQFTQTMTIDCPNQPNNSYQFAKHTGQILLGDTYVSATRNGVPTYPVDNTVGWTAGLWNAQPLGTASLIWPLIVEFFELTH